MQILTHLGVQSTVEQVKAQACRLAGLSPDQAEIKLDTRDPTPKHELQATVASLGLDVDPDEGECCIVTLMVSQQSEAWQSPQPVLPCWPWCHCQSLAPENSCQSIAPEDRQLGESGEEMPVPQ